MIPIEVLVQTPARKLEYRGIHPHIRLDLQVKVLMNEGLRLIRFRFGPVTTIPRSQS
jgi:hypothetical protein